MPDTKKRDMLKALGERTVFPKARTAGVMLHKQILPKMQLRGRMGPQVGPGYSWVGAEGETAAHETYLLRDEFDTAITAGSVNGSSATPGPGARAVTDTNSKISIAGGNLVVASASTANTDRVNWPIQTRAAGRMLLVNINTITTSGGRWGWDADTATQPTSGLVFWTAGVIYTQQANQVIGAWSAATNYWICSILRAAGSMELIKGGAFTNWTLLYLDAATSGNMYPTYSVATSGDVIAVPCVRVPSSLWLPVPLASDGFATAFGTTDGAGHAETSGVGAGGSGLTWTQDLGVWGISGAKANCGTLDGGESIGVATVPCGTTNVVARVEVTRAAGAAGMVLRYTDADNFLYAYHDGTNAALIEVVAGTPANVVAPAAKAYSAGKPLVVVLDGTSGTLYYNSAKVGATGTTAITTGNAHGLWSNNTGPTLDNFVVYARGTGGEYGTGVLDRFIA